MPRVKVTMGLPFRMQVADDTEFGVPFHDLRIAVTLREYDVPKTEEEEQASGIDDGRGTFLRSRVSVLFPEQTLEEVTDHWGEKGDPYVQASVVAINECIIAYRYVTRHLFAQPMAWPPEVTAVVVDESGELVPNFAFTHAFNFPGGRHLKPTFQVEALKEIQNLIDGETPIKFERSLLLDAEYFAELGDVRSALFYLDTALQVFIERILANEEYRPSGYYSKWDEGLMNAGGHSLYEAEFTDLRGAEDNKVNAFEILETVHEVRNSIAHEGRPIFRIGGLTGGWKSRFIENHKKWDGTEVTPPSAKAWVQNGRAIIQWVEGFIG